MVLIFSDSMDRSTNNVIDWLIYYQVDFKRLNENEFIPYFATLSSVNKLDGIKSIWVRRNMRENPEEFCFGPNSSNSALYEQMQKKLSEEVKTLKEYFVFSFKGFVFGNIQKTRLNKLSTLLEAQKAGLLIPEYSILSSKKELLLFKEKIGQIITKPMFEPLMINHNAIGRLCSYTEEVTDVTINELPDRFFPSFFQKKIEKKYELRIFYMLGNFYSMAIFSQNDEQTSVDFRRYNVKKPNRVVPYLLQKEQKEQIIKLMTNLNLNTGSVDLIKSDDGNFYFLEVNPTGQYDMVSKPCNYFLDRRIAKSLIHNSNEKN